jgi:MGT family glycosyltransferase
MYHQEPLIPPAFTSWALPTTRWGRWRNRIGHFGQNWGVGPVIRSVNRDLARRGRTRITRVRDLFSPYAQLSPLVAELDFPWTDLPPQFHYLGPLGAARSEAAIEFPWDRLDGRPLVYASLGTIKSSKNARVYRRIAAACADLDVQLVMALGKWSASRGQARDGLGELAGQPIIVEFAPQLALLQRAAAFITHAGQNSVLEGLGQGVPLLCLPRSDDQPGMAARVAHVGAGLKASFARSEPAELRGLLQRVLTEETFREQARRIQTAIAGSGGPSRAADIFEQVLTQRQPVLRSA